jgi:homogentisate 1,2-dioxygenase
MNTHAKPQTLARAGHLSVADTRYMSGFGNSFETETLPGALPIGRNSPQKPAYGLYAEQLSGSPFTAPQATNQRSWLYRINPSVKHTRRFRKISRGNIRSAGLDREEADTALAQLRWDPIPLPKKKLSFVEGLSTITFAGDVEGQTGMAAHIALVTRSMVDEYFFCADGELMVVAQEGRLRFCTEFGIIDITPGEIAVIPRGVVMRVEIPDGPSRAYVCENYGGALTLPDRGPTAWPTRVTSSHPSRPMRTSRARRCSMSSGAA